MKATTGEFLIDLRAPALVDEANPAVAACPSDGTGSKPLGAEGVASVPTAKANLAVTGRHRDRTSSQPTGAGAATSGQPTGAEGVASVPAAMVNHAAPRPS